jgi:hypothetical protein
VVQLAVAWAQRSAPKSVVARALLSAVQWELELVRLLPQKMTGMDMNMKRLLFM